MATGKEIIFLLYSRENKAVQVKLVTTDVVDQIHAKMVPRVVRSVTSEPGVIIAHVRLDIMVIDVTNPFVHVTMS